MGAFLFTPTANQAGIQGDTKAPGTEALGLPLTDQNGNPIPQFSGLFGDLHLNNTQNLPSSFPLVWEDDPNDRATSNDTGTDLPSIILHEVGHALGLDHPDDQFCEQNLAVMCEYTTLRGGALRSLQQVDIEGIVYLYGPPGNTTDPGAPCAPTAPASPSHLLITQ